MLIGFFASGGSKGKYNFFWPIFYQNNAVVLPKGSCFDTLLLRDATIAVIICVFDAFFTAHAVILNAPLGNTVYWQSSRQA